MLNKMKLFFTALIALLLEGVVPFSWAKDAEVNKMRHEVRYPMVKESTDLSYGRATKYFVDVLQLALEKTNADFKLSPVPVEPVFASRNARMLMKKRYDICWMHTNRDREEQLRPIRIPLLKGLLGWRIFFIRQSDKDKFGAVNSLDQLSGFIAGQGHDWLDTKVLLENGLYVKTSVFRDSLISMLDFSRIDFFPRSIFEIWDEQLMLEKSNIAIDTHLALWYPNAAYFFLTKDNQQLAALIESGLEKALSDGSFNELFFRYYGEAIKNSDLNKRKVFILKNPFIPPLTPLNRPDLWHSNAAVRRELAGFISGNH